MLAVEAGVRDGSHGCGRMSSDTAHINTFSFNPEDDQLPDLGDANLLESIDFDDLFAGINDVGDVLPDLETMDPDIFAEFSVSTGGTEEESSSGKSTTDEDSNHHQRSPTEEEEEEEEEDQAGDHKLVFRSEKGDETVNSSKRERGNSNDKGRKSSSSSGKHKNQGKRKVKVDWTPELHRRFVQAVEQLGVDKAVPSRILELMGIDCLTRHNIASHLQKYRSHRKHLLAREAEAASWTQRRQMAVAGGGGGKMSSEVMSRWAAAPTIGFPPAMHPAQFRPPSLHVWGHPSVDQTLLHIWPKHLMTHPSPPPPPAWIPTRPPPTHLSFWHPHAHGPPVPSPGTPCFPQAIPATRIGAAAVGVPHQPHVTTGQMGPHPPPFDPQPWKESIDEAIGDVLSKPWQSLPLGLKPPSIDSVMVELQRQGVPKVPPNLPQSS